MLVSQVDLDIGDHHMENNQGVTSKDFDKFFNFDFDFDKFDKFDKFWRGEISDWWTSQAAGTSKISSITSDSTSNLLQE